MTPDEIAEYTAKSCAAQGVPLKVTDPEVLRRAAAIIARSAQAKASAA